MKYSVGDIVMLQNGEMVYIFSVEKITKTYYVFEHENQENTYRIKENDISRKILGI